LRGDFIDYSISVNTIILNFKLLYFRNKINKLDITQHKKIIIKTLKPYKNNRYQCFRM